MGTEQTPGPTPAAERIRSLDVLRGIAVLGILIMNIQSFSMTRAAYVNPYAYGDMTGANGLAWLIGHVVADRKFMTIFSLLFGAGVVMMTSRREAAGQSACSLHLRRMAWLLVFGVLHGFLLWHGDILHAYAVCGVLVFFLRRCSPRTLAISGVLVVAVASAVNLFWQITIPYWPAGALAEVESSWWRPSEDAVTRDLAAYRGGWVEQQSRRASSALFMQTQHLLTETLWRAGGLMLLGMALFKRGVLSAGLSTRIYLWMVGGGLLVGLPVVAYGVCFRTAAAWDVSQALFLGSQFNYWGSIPVALAYVGAVMLLCRSGRLGSITRPLAAVGQMALTAYLLQTVTCTAVFYGHGLGLYGRVDRVGQTGIVFAVWAMLLIGCPLWRRRFRFGPVEWLWRSLTYMKLQPIR